MCCKRLFEAASHTEAYLRYRPGTSEKVVQSVMNYMESKTSLKKTSGRYNLMLDVGCGSGQSSQIFSSYFHSVIGVDPSRNQIKEARKCKSQNMTFKEGSGENLAKFVKPNSVDLITCGQSVHWLDQELFFKECRKVLHPSGCLAMYSYFGHKLQPNVDKIFKKFYGQLDKYVPNIKDTYGGIYKNLICDHKVIDRSLEFTKSYSLFGLHGLLTTWSSYRTYLAEPGCNPKVLDDMISNMKSALGADKMSSKDVFVDVTFPLILILCSTPYV